MKWHSMTTAPKDATIVLLRGKNTMALAYWSGAYWHKWDSVMARLPFEPTGWFPVPRLKKTPEEKLLDAIMGRSDDDSTPV